MDSEKLFELMEKMYSEIQKLLDNGKFNTQF